MTTFMIVNLAARGFGVVPRLPDADFPLAEMPGMGVGRALEGGGATSITQAHVPVPIARRPDCRVASLPGAGRKKMEYNT